MALSQHVVSCWCMTHVGALQVQEMHQMCSHHLKPYQGLRSCMED